MENLVHEMVISSFLFPFTKFFLINNNKNGERKKQQSYIGDDDDYDTIEY